MDPAPAMQLLIATAATCNRAIAVENTALAFRAGLELTGFEPVISAGSASSAQAELLFAALGAEGAGFAGSVGQDVDSLTEFARVAADCGVPALMVNQVRAQYLSFTAHAGPDRPIQDMINYQLGTI
jgi:3-hydroxyisobutyrate dehydrogenase-like beta-hydroxyacid dehydrogenase